MQSDIRVHVDLPQTEYNLVSKKKIPQCYYPTEYKELVSEDVF